MPPHPSANFEIQKYHQNESNFKGVYSRSNLRKLKVGVYKIKLDKYKLIETHWIALYVNGDNVTYFHSFGIELIPEQIKKFIGNKNIAANIYRIQANDSIICGYFRIGFINFMLESKILLDYTNLFFPNEYLKNDKLILKCFQ